VGGGIVYEKLGTLNHLGSAGERVLVAGTYQTKSAIYTALDTDGTIECTANTFTVTLYTAVGNLDRQIIIKNTGTGIITIDGNAAETIDGVLTQVLGRYVSMTLRSNGTNWVIVSEARIRPRTGTVASSATPTINTDDVDFYSITALTVAITSFTTNLSGTPSDGQRFWISITGTATRSLTWGTSFESSTVNLPNTTVSTNRLDVGFIWNAATSKWRCVGTV
jgi:hypothetical protein